MVICMRKYMYVPVRNIIQHRTFISKALLGAEGAAEEAAEPEGTEAERVAAEQEAARVAAEAETAHVAAEAEAARVAAEAEAARAEAERVAAVYEAARVA
jgi:hypothetical protein